MANSPRWIDAIERLHKRMHLIFGSLYVQKWAGVDPEEMKQLWAEELACYAGDFEPVLYALNACLDLQYPPTAGEFKAICRRAPRKTLPALPYRPTPEENARIRECALEAERSVKAKRDLGGLMWATHPKSHLALSMVFAARDRGDQRFATVIERLIDDGICTSEGKLLKRWDGNSWLKA